MTKVVLDTDMGSDVDDALCLALALASPEVELVAITNVGNESRRRARISRKLLELGGRTDVPVYAGCRVPVMAGEGFNWFGHEGEGILAPGEEPEIEAEHAVGALIRIFDRRDGVEDEGVELVAIGPLTNIAAALLLEPDLAGRIARLTIMGGHVRKVEYGGHVFAPGVDYNLCSDPQAAQLVLRSGIPVRLVTADVTLRTWLRETDLERIWSGGSPLQRAVVEATRIWTPLQKRLFGEAGCNTDDDNAAFLHDPLALVCAYDERFCRFEDLEVRPFIDEHGTFRTVECDGPEEGSFPMRVAVDVDAAAVRAHYVERVAAS